MFGHLSVQIIPFIVNVFFNYRKHTRRLSGFSFDGAKNNDEEKRCFFFIEILVVFCLYVVLVNVEYKANYLNTTVSSIAPKHCTILFCINASTFSSKCRFGSCLPTFLMANCSGVIFSSSSSAWKVMEMREIISVMSDHTEPHFYDPRRSSIGLRQLTLL